MLVGFITSKVLAYYVGPTGMAMVGNLRDFFNGLRSFSTLGFYNGIVKYLSEKPSDYSSSKRVISTSFLSVLIISFLSGICIYLFSNELSEYLFSNDARFSLVLKLLGAALPILSINTLVIASLNGFSEFKKLLKIQIIGHFAAGTITVFLIVYYSTFGALLAVVLSELVLLLVLFFYLPTLKPILSQIRGRFFDRSILMKLGGFSIMALISAFLLPWVYILIRNYIITNLGIEEAGYWEGMNRLSRYYLMFVGSLLTLYILPKFSATDNPAAFRKEVMNFYKTVLPWFAVGLLLIYFFRRIIISLVFTTSFLPMSELFMFQLLGDFVKVMALVISYQFLAKKMIYYYVITEIISVGMFYLLSIWLIEIHDLQGVVMAHFINYVIYFILLVYIFRRPLIQNKLIE